MIEELETIYASGTFGDAVVKNGEVFTPTYDAIGNVSEYVDSSGTIVAHQEYDPFGNALVSSGDAGTFTHWFSTKPWCGVTGMDEYQYRKYRPGMGRWMSRDPMWEQSDVSLVRFLANNVMNRVDRLGLYGNPVTYDGYVVGTGWGEYYSDVEPTSVSTDFKCCGELIYNVKYQCCHSDASGSHVFAKYVETQVKICCSTNKIYGISGHCFLGYFNEDTQRWHAVGFYAADKEEYGFQHIITGGSPGVVKDDSLGMLDLTDKECETISMSPCEYDIARFHQEIRNLSSLVESISPTYHLPFYDCRKWARHRVRECMMNARRHE